MPKSLEELRKIREQMDGLNRQLGDALAKQKQEGEEWLARQKIEAERKQQELLDKLAKDHEARMAYQEKVGFPITQHLGVMLHWEHMPDFVRDEEMTKITGLVEQAKGGDQISQQILTGLKSRLVAESEKNRKVSLTALPSLEWEVKDKPEPK